MAAPSYVAASTAEKAAAPRSTRNNTAILKPEDIDQLKSFITGDVIVKGEAPDDKYQEAINRWNRYQNNEAGIVVCPKTDDEVSQTLRFVARYNLDLAVSGGRHSYHGASSVEGGIVIDMQNFRTVSVDKKAKVISAGGGCLAEEVEGPAAKEGLHVVFGAVNDTGIGGLSLGGGVGWLSGQYGLATDNIVALRVVLADGSIVTANEHENQDLFWAMRGAGGNFGVVTEFKFKGHAHRNPGGNVYFGILAYPMEQLETLLSTVNKMYSGAIREQKGRMGIMLALLRGPDAPAHAPGVLLFYDGTEEEAKAVGKPLFDLELLAIMGGPQPYADTTNIGKMMPDGIYNRHYATGDCMDFPLQEDVVLANMKFFLDFVNKIGDPARKSVYVVEARLGTCVVTADRTAIAYAARWPNVGFMGPSLQWADPDLDEIMTRAVKDMGRVLLEGVKKHRAAALTDGQPLNGGVKGTEDRDLESVHPTLNAGDRKISTIFGPNVDRLRRLKRRYDPESMFDKWYYIRPAETS